jgi:hypothetical protein
MNFGKYRKKIFNSPSLLIKFYFSAGTVVLFIFFLIYTNYVLRSFKKEAEVVPNLFARFFSYSTEDDWEGLLSQYIFEEVITEIDYPIILTDSRKEPLYWKNVGVREGVRFQELTQEEKDAITRNLHRMERERNIIPLYYNSYGDSVLNYAYYSESKSMQMLRNKPYIEAGFVLLFVIFGVYAIYFFKRNEKDVLWISMAKEMAHQLGTPISSLLGWLNVLSSRIEVCTFETDMKKIIGNMENDVEQLRKVAQRFGKIGSDIELTPTVLHDTIEASVEYYKQRLPHLTKKVDIIFISKIQNKEIKVDPDLIKWAIENLIKNAIDAMHKRGGNIIVIAFQDNNKTYIIVQDEGKGIAKSMFSKIFEPGVSSKHRGWGLGLSLSKRIVEEFHHGKIHVVQSVVGEGSTIEIILPEN